MVGSVLCIQAAVTAMAVRVAKATRLRDHPFATDAESPLNTGLVVRAALAAVAVVTSLLAAGPVAAGTAAAGIAALAPVPQRERAALFRHIDAGAPQSVALLEEVVNVNSGTFNVAGVRQVGERLERETRRVSMDSVGRAAHLVAERKGRKGRRLLLIGHMDTVFEPFSCHRRAAHVAAQAFELGACPGKNARSSPKDGQDDLGLPRVVFLGLVPASLCAAVSADRSVASSTFLRSQRVAPMRPQPPGTGEKACGACSQ